MSWSMHRTLVIAALLWGATACDPLTSPGPGDGTVGGETVQFLRAPCGSIAPSTAMPSVELDAPTPIMLSEVVSARIDPASATNTVHYWEIELEPGLYHVVVDEHTVPRSITNVGLNIERLNDRGIEEGQVLRGNEIDRQIRDHGILEITAPTVVGLEVTPVFGMEDYLLGVFAVDEEVPSPFFEDCPVFDALALDTPFDFTIADLGEAQDEAWFTFDAAPGDYRFTVDAARVEGTASNIIYGVTAFDQLGQWDRARNVLRANEIDVSVRLEGTLNVSEPTEFWLRVLNGATAVDITVTPESL